MQILYRFYDSFSRKTEVSDEVLNRTLNINRDVRGKSAVNGGFDRKILYKWRR